MAAEESQNVARVNLVSACRIYPAFPPPESRTTLFLGANDIAWRFYHYNRRILFYRLDNWSYSEAVGQLKKGLSQVLSEFFPWTGRLVQQEDGRLALACTDSAGVEFIEASMEQDGQHAVTLAELQEDDFSYRSFFKELAPFKTGDVAQMDSLIYIQITRLPKDEGLVLGVSHTHLVADGSALWQFLKSWGECSRGLPISVPPIHARELLGPNHLILPPAPADPSVKSLTQGACSSQVFPPPADLAQRKFHFSKEMLEALKQKAKTQSADLVAPLSSYQVLCAHLWRCLSSVRADCPETKSGLYVIGDFRSRLTPQLPKGFFGNVVFRKMVKASVGDLQAETLGATAKRVQDVVLSMDGDVFKRAMGMVEVLDPTRPFAEVSAGSEPGMVTFSVASSPKFPAYDVEFGFGRPLSVQSPEILGDGEIVLFAGAEGQGSVDASVALPPAVMRRLEGEDQSVLLLGVMDRETCTAERKGNGGLA